jgi:hypothetical protein
VSGFQFTPMGMIPLGAPIPAMPDEVAPGFAPTSDLATIVEASAPPCLAPTGRPGAAPVAIQATKPITGRELLKAAKARVRELDKILRTMPALKAEREAMQRLVDAASPVRRPKLVAMKAAGN